MKKIALRQCVGCGAQKDKREMIRVLRDANGQFRVDKTGKLNGRGAYICNDIECAKACAAKNGLDRSFKEKIDKEVYNLLIESLDDSAVKEGE